MLRAGAFSIALCNDSLWEVLEDAFTQRSYNCHSYRAFTPFLSYSVVARCILFIQSSQNSIFLTNWLNALGVDMLDLFLMTPALWYPTLLLLLLGTLS